MIQIKYTTQGGEACTLEADIGQTLMEALRDADVEGIDAICGGSCACATCHVYIEKSWRDKLTAQDETEDELLEDSDVRESHSRLACQIPLTEALNGITLTIPPEE